MELEGGLTKRGAKGKRQEAREVEGGRCKSTADAGRQCGACFNDQGNGRLRVQKAERHKGNSRNRDYFVYGCSPPCGICNGIVGVELVVLTCPSGGMPLYLIGT